MAPTPSKRKAAERAPEQNKDTDRRSRETPKDLWDITPDSEVDSRAIITDWASI
ncbi:hypothetical protein IV417_03965 [Alphaproteobacteria bacterium KMM 3653]|uniref:Uncharacterized protein n=1 Tax=Harenicola maris TaxID=2841044 RepID=A0AAP2G6S3_9RHOB|nr:hypothetical protein [Harenicola maris]